MGGNTIGKIFCLTTFGESHGIAIGGIIDGMPPGIVIDPGFIQTELDRRRPGLSVFVSSRNESDTLEILSGVFEGKSLGSPIAFMVRNTDARPSDYEHLRDVLRPSQSDFTYLKKYGLRDHRGGGRASARETLARVAGGAFAKIFLYTEGIDIIGFTSSIGRVRMEVLPDQLNKERIYQNPLRCPDEKTAIEMEHYLSTIQKDGDTIGSSVSCYIRGLPPGLGEPVFDKLDADLAKAIISINACVGFEYGMGFSSAKMKGSEHNDSFQKETTGGKTEISPLTNRAGGILAGISTGRDVFFRAAFKPVPSLQQEQETLTIKGEAVRYLSGGRHDICIAPRAVAVVEAMAALVIADHYLRWQTGRL